MKISVFQQTPNNNILYASAGWEGYYSIDSGRVWKSMKLNNNQYPACNALIFYFDYIITGSGWSGSVALSNDNGENWIKKIGINTFVILDDYIYAGTSGFGIYQAKLSDLTDVEDNKPITNKIEVSPNPFAQTTTIKYSLPNTGKVKLVVFNALGYEAAVLVDGYMDSGWHEAVFDGSGVPSGAYFYVLQAGGDVQTGKLMLIKK